MPANDETPNLAHGGEETFRDLIERSRDDAGGTIDAPAPTASRRSHARKPVGAPPLVNADDEFMRPGVQHKEMRRLKQGKFPLNDDLRIDLHGLTRDEAYQALDEFLDRCLAARARCALIICGKGIHSPTGKPVLKSSIRGWLAEHDKVLAYCPAQRRDGGAGALYALLKIKRPAR